MKKKTLLTLVTLAVFAAFLAMLPVAYSGAAEIMGNNFLTNVNMLFTEHLRDVNNNYSAKTNALNILLERQAEMRGYPYFGLIFDKEGNLIARSGNYIKILEEDGNLKFFSLDEYINDNIRNQLNALKETIHSYDFKLEYNIENGEPVPVKITFHSPTSDETTITFKSGEAQFSIHSADTTVTFAFIYLSDIDTQHYNHKVYTKLKNKFSIDELGKEAAEQLSDDNHGGGGTTTSAFADFRGDIIINGEEYYLFDFAERNEVLDNVTSQNFVYYIIEGIFCFSLLGAIILIIVNKMYNKNEIMKKSRLAFISAAAHELKTPIAIISNQCELVLENIAPEKNTEYIRSVYDEALRMNRLVSTLLQYNKLNSIESVTKEYACIDNIVKAELTKYEPMIKEKNLCVLFDSEVLTAKCNVELISLAVDNYISNAIKHTPSGGIIKVTVKNTKVSVYNQGSHIDQNDAVHIWEDFYKEDKSRQRNNNSTGMGLAICKRIFELHGFRYGFKNCDDGVLFEFDVK